MARENSPIAVGANADPVYPASHLKRILAETRTIAAVGLSANVVRPSYFVARYLQLKGYRVIPVNPAYAGGRILDEPVYATFSDIPAEADPIDMVDIFRRSEHAGAIVDEALGALGPRGLKTIWMQIGVIDWAAAARAEAASVEIVMNHCPKIEYARHFGELRWGGFNTGIVSSKLS